MKWKKSIYTASATTPPSSHIWYSFLDMPPSCLSIRSLNVSVYMCWLKNCWWNVLDGSKKLRLDMGIFQLWENRSVKWQYYISKTIWKKLRRFQIQKILHSLLLLLGFSTSRNLMLTWSYIFSHWAWKLERIYFLIT